VFVVAGGTPQFVMDLQTKLHTLEMAPVSDPSSQVPFATIHSPAMKLEHVPSHRSKVASGLCLFAGCPQASNQLSPSFQMHRKRPCSKKALLAWRCPPLWLWSR
jgi:hypothetical protein